MAIRDDDHVTNMTGGPAGLIPVDPNNPDRLSRSQEVTRFRPRTEGLFDRIDKVRKGGLGISRERYELCCE